MSEQLCYSGETCRVEQSCQSRRVRAVVSEQSCQSSHVQGRLRGRGQNGPWRIWKNVWLHDDTDTLCRDNEIWSSEDLTGVEANLGGAREDLLEESLAVVHPGGLILCMMVLEDLHRLNGQSPIWMVLIDMHDGR